MTGPTVARLLITCADKPGIVAAVCGFLFSHGANITSLDQHSTDPENGVFFMRLEFQTPYLDMPREALGRAFKQVVGDRFEMDWHLTYAADGKKLALLASKTDHCLLELLWRSAREELPCEVTMVISNHNDLRKPVEDLGIPFHHVPVSKETKPEAEAQMLELLRDKADCLVLARYMQILSPEFVNHYENRIINIHHSFLPAFAGADPYRQAYEKGVKLIGATAHFVTGELDTGPIIAQDVINVYHRNTVQDLKILGQDIERQVLVRAVKWHLEDRIIVFGNKTIVFSL